MFWLIFIPSLVWYLFGFQYIVRQFIRNELGNYSTFSYSQFSWGDLGFAVTIGSFTALFLAPFGAFHMLFKRWAAGKELDAAAFAQRVVGRTPEQRHEDQKRAIREKDNRIAQLERELEIGRNG